MCCCMIEMETLMVLLTYYFGKLQEKCRLLIKMQYQRAVKWYVATGSW